jgi:hypothetical protein
MVSEWMASTMRLDDLLFDRPLVNVNLVKGNFDLALHTTEQPVGELESTRSLAEITGAQREWRLGCLPYPPLLHDERPHGSGADDLDPAELSTTAKSSDQEPRAAAG